MAKRKLTPEQQKHKEIGDRMQKEGLYICEYCRFEVSKAGIQVALFNSSPDMWVLNNATGKLSCPKSECNQEAKAEQETAKSKGAFHY